MKICVDPGHGGKDNGAVWQEKLGYFEEADTNLSIAYLLRCELESSGIDVIMTREEDRFVTLQGRCDLANSENVDVFVSIHCDAWHNITTSGISVHIYPSSSIKTRYFGGMVYEQLMKTFPDHKGRGVKESNFHVLRWTKMPAILVECEFITNPKTRKFLREPFNQLQTARSIAKGVKL